MKRIMAGLTGLATVLAGSALAVAPARAGLPAVPAAPEGSRTVSYQGYRVAVPQNWPVVDLAAEPHACLRFDRPAVYLGRPGNQSACPSRLVGRTAGLHIEPIDARSADRLPAAAATTAPGAATVAAPVSRDDAIQVAVRDAGVLVTAVHTPLTEALVRRVLGTATLGPDAVSPPAATEALTRPGAASAPLAAAGPQPGTFVGRGFDTCTAPSQATMNAWRTSSPYRAVGIYISGASRSCSQPNLTATWVTNQTNNGWRLIPIELDRQAPCGTRTPKMSADPATARSQGASRATSAVSAAQALGILAGSTIYNDIEHYPSNASCKAAVLSYLSGWTERLHALGYLSGMYSSGSSGVADLCGAYNDPAYTRVDQLWFAWWNDAANLDAGPYCPAEYYANHQRLHQYAGDVQETWGGVRIQIDRNYLDVSTDGGGGQPPTWSSIVDNSTAGRFTASANWGTSTYSAQRHGTDYRFADPVPSSDVAWYRVNVPETANYQVSVWYPADSGYNDSTPFVVATTSGNQTVRVNQRLTGGQWVPLGVFPLAAGDGDRVGVSRWTSGTGYVIADAVRVTRV
ncbi:glycoside hydrolase domain-containing protein [Plantactinospora endophytica]|uniref:DUF1906 domain-containing protein n=1 Tax=Plantactinospora endophytica TaxID=673535 RepID=A0ABQ4E8V5_9ACTN|nr:hypothetical protein Pen02_61030 [Plantactinospora endophytica]